MLGEPEQVVVLVGDGLAEAVFTADDLPKGVILMLADLVKVVVYPVFYCCCAIGGVHDVALFKA